MSDDPYRSLNLSYVSGDDPQLVRANRARVMDALGARLESWTSGRQIHGSAVARVTARERGSGADVPGSTIPDTDALWTDEPGTALAVLTADCVPLLLADPARRRIGVVHAGWRGLVAGVIERAVEAMGEPGVLDATIGPAIGPCCYEVGDEVASEAAAALGDDVVRDGPRGRLHLDLWRGGLDALRRAGVHAVRLAGLCTRCEPHRFFSHRAGDAGRQGLIVSLEP